MNDRTGTMHPDSVPAHEPSAIARRMQDEIVSPHTRTEQYFSLDEVSARTEELLDGQWSVAGHVQALFAAYEVDEPRLRVNPPELPTNVARRELMTRVARGASR